MNPKLDHEKQELRSRGHQKRMSMLRWQKSWQRLKMNWDILRTFGLNQNYFFFILHFPILLPLPTSPSPIRLCLPFVYFTNELFLYLVFVVFPASSSSHKRQALIFKVNSNLLVFSEWLLFIYHHLVHHTIGDMSINLQFKVLPFFSVLW